MRIYFSLVLFFVPIFLLGQQHVQSRNSFGFDCDSYFFESNPDMELKQLLPEPNIVLKASSQMEFQGIIQFQDIDLRCRVSDPNDCANLELSGSYGFQFTSSSSTIEAKLDPNGVFLLTQQVIVPRGTGIFPIFFRIGTFGQNEQVTVSCTIIDLSNDVELLDKNTLAWSWTFEEGDCPQTLDVVAPIDVYTATHNIGAGSDGLQLTIQMEDAVPQNRFENRLIKEDIASIPLFVIEDVFNSSIINVANTFGIDPLAVTEQHIMVFYRSAFVGGIFTGDDLSQFLDFYTPQFLPLKESVNGNPVERVEQNYKCSDATPTLLEHHTTVSYSQDGNSINLNIQKQ